MIFENGRATLKMGEIVERLKADFPHEADEMDMMLALQSRLGLLACLVLAGEELKPPEKQQEMGQYLVEIAAFALNWHNNLALDEAEHTDSP